MIQGKDVPIFAHTFWERIPQEKRALLTGITQESALLQSILGQALLAYLLKKKKGIDYSQCRIVYGDWGKPSIAEKKEVQFNISHSGVWVACALGQKEVGLDVERVCPIKRGYTRFLLSPEEKIFLQKGGDLENGLFRLWVLKESYCKYTGKGLYLPFNTLYFYQDQKGFWNLKTDKTVFFREYPISQEYRMAACSREIPPDSISMVDISELRRVLNL